MSATGVLVSGGLDSTVLLAEQATQSEVQPIYVSVGLAWEAAELNATRVVLDAFARRYRVHPLAILSLDMMDVYGPTHWALRGTPPSYHTADEEVYLAGRNIVLLGKAGIYCAARAVQRLVIGTLDHNPFPDATPAFRQAMATALSIGLNHRIAIDAPFASMSKAKVVQRGADLGVPLELTLSCMNPVDRRADASISEGAAAAPPTLRFQHCGRCSKCRERHDAFLEARVQDPTDYADRTYVG